MALNLVRNSRVFFTTNVSTATGAVTIGTLLSTNTFEVQVQDGFSFSQSTNSDTVAVNEAGENPTRGTRSFNTSLAPVDFSFTTYVRPRLSGTVIAEEQVLWNALLGSKPLATAVAGTVTSITRATTITGTAVIVGTAIPATVQGVVLAAGVIVTLGGVTGTFASEWNTPFKIATVSATTVTGEFLTAPVVGAGLTAATATGTTFTVAAWVPQAAVAADTLKPAAYSLVTAARSGVNQLQAFGLIIVIDSATYVLDNCALGQAQIDFGLDGIASIQWSGNATAIRALGQTTINDATPPNTTLAGVSGVAGVVLQKVTTANYITNKLSTVQLVSNIGGTGGTVYTLALTGGTLTINNNISYITPANLGVVNIPIGYYTGNLAISGNITAYLNTGTTPTANNTGALLSTILANVATAAETKYRMELDIGGGNNPTRVEIEMDGCSISVPTIETAQIVSTTINFNAQGTLADQSAANAAYDLTNTNPVQIRYFSA